MSSSIRKSERPSARWLAYLSTLALLSACERFGQSSAVDSGEGGQAGPVFQLVGVQGGVEVRPGDQGPWLNVIEGQTIRLGDGLRTARGGRVAVAFEDGNRLEIRDGTSIRVGERQGTYELFLGEGEIEVNAAAKAGRGFRVVFGDGSETLVVQNAHLNVQRVQGDNVKVRMIIGQASILRGAEAIKVENEVSFSLSVGQGQIVERQAVAATLRDRTRRSLIRPPKKEKFARPDSQAVPLEPGTEIRAMSPIAIEDTLGGEIGLERGSRAVFSGTYQDKEGRTSSLTLNDGATRIRLRREGDLATVQEVVTPHVKVVAKARGLSADVAIQAGKKETTIAVNAGVAEISLGGETVALTAGQRLSAGAELGTPTSALPPVRCQEGLRTRIFFDVAPPDVALLWKAEAASVAELEIAHRSDFESPFMREQVEQSSFVLSGLERKTYFWRVRHKGASAPGPIGRIEIDRDPFASRGRGAALQNQVPDTGIQTTILFQGKVPELTFRFDEWEGAQSYMVRIFSEDDLERPVLQRTVSENKMVLKAGVLTEGTYFWYQAALDERGAEIHASQMNKLVLQFDNAATLLRIDGPPSGSPVKSRSVEVYGQAPTGTRLQVNGRTVVVPADGRFRAKVDGVRAHSSLVFLLQSNALGDVYYVRKLGR